jgi:putative cell wall-binding protein
MSTLSHFYAQSTLMSGNLTASMTQLQDTITHLQLSDGAGGNNCLPTTDSGLATWLTSVDVEWDECAVVDVVVVGGSAVVSDAVLTELGGLVDGSVTRVWGANRYATAAALSEAHFAPGVSTVFIATGENFPDALAGGPAGVINDGPILLVRQNAVPSETAAELARLSPSTIVVLGGPAVVSSSVVTELEGMASCCVSRYWGADRYTTAAAVSEAVFPTGASMVFIVTGVNFPDAVAAGPVAGMLDAPILLVTGASVPTSTGAEVTRLAQ